MPVPPESPARGGISRAAIGHGDRRRNPGLESVVEDHLRAGMTPDQARRAATEFARSPASRTRRVRRRVPRPARHDPLCRAIAAADPVAGVAALSSRRHRRQHDNLHRRQRPAPARAVRRFRRRSPVDVFRAEEGRALGNPTSYPHSRTFARGRRPWPTCSPTARVSRKRRRATGPNWPSLTWSAKTLLHWATPAAGRFFARADGVPGASPAAYQLPVPAAALNGDRAVVGMTIQINATRSPCSASPRSGSAAPI